ncbi:MAG: winged helix-turn-helix domain-containing protein [Desulfobacteraceae bacterium]|nr:MAG: winged helix-turn-helix domain-containing protein [Desulfobacteraceae bacterium]
MPEDDTPKRQKADDLKALRRARKETIDRVSGRVKEQKKSLKAIRTKLENATCTVPELAAATGMAADMVLWYVAAMKKYGQIAEVEKEDGYYRYSLTAAAETPGEK